MILTIIIGETGSGKSYFAKQLIQKYPQICAYDIQNEYGLPVFNSKNNNKRFQLPNNIYNFKDFVVFTKKLRGFCFVIEEATGILRGNVGSDFIQSILSKRHSQNRYIIIFHAIHRVPPQLMEFADYVILFKTNDLEKNVKSKFEWILNDFRELKTLPKHSKKIIRQSNLAKENVL